MTSSKWIREFSKGEWTGVAMMVVGLVVGVLSQVIANVQYQAGLRVMVQAMEQSASLTQMQAQVQRSMQNMSNATSFAIWSNLAFWLFLAGLGVFVVMGRIRRQQVVALPA